MRITLFISSLTGGGAERSLTKLANQLAERGWRVTVITYDSPSTDWHQLNQSVTRKATSRPPTASEAKSLVAKRWSPIRFAGYLRFVMSLRSSLLATRPDVVLSFFAGNNVLAGLSLFGSGIPVVVSERGHTGLRPVSAPLHFLRKLIYPHMSAVISVNEESSQWIRDNTRSTRVVTIPNSVELPLPVGGPSIDPNLPAANHLGDKTLLAAGRLVPVKGFDRLIDAFARLGECSDGWRLVILGEGNDRAELSHQIHELGLVERVQMPGAVGNMAEWFLAADLYVLTSRSEGFPNVLMEALAHGCPAVAFDTGGSSQIIRHGIDGYLVPQNDLDCLVTTLRRLMTDEDLREQFASQADDAKHRFAVSLMIERYEKVFREVTWH